MMKAVIVLKNPFDTIGQLVEKKRGTTQTKGQIHIHKITGLPVNTEQVPIIGVDRYQSEGRLEVGHCLEGPLTKRLDDTNGVVHLNVGQRERIFGYVIVNAISLGVGKMVNSPPVR